MRLDCGGSLHAGPMLASARMRQGLCSLRATPNLRGRIPLTSADGPSPRRESVGRSGTGAPYSAALRVVGARELPPMPSAHGQHDAPIAIGCCCRGVSGVGSPGGCRGWRRCARCWRNRFGSGPRSGSKKAASRGSSRGREQGTEQGIAQGIAQGREQGIAQGRAEERALLCRQAERKFDVATARRLAAALEDVADPDRLAEVGDWIIECGTAADLLARVSDERRRGV